MLWYIVPLFVGFLVVSQGVLNKIIGVQSGLSLAVLINACVFLVLAILLLILSLKLNMLPDFIKPQWQSYQFQWWHLIPGCCGFLLVLLIPWSIQHLGASLVFLLIISSQIVLSIVYDFWFNGIALSISRIFAIILVLAGAFFYVS